MALRSQRSPTRTLRRGSIVWGWLAVALLLAACGGGSPTDRASSDGSDASSSTTSSTVPPGGSTTTSTTTQQTDPPASRERAYPAGGPTDRVIPPNEPSYELITGKAGCQKLLDETAGWTRETTDDTQGMDELDGIDTYPLYKSAAYACLGRWSEARATFAEIRTPPTFANNQCARLALLAWLTALIHESEADSSFSPVFVPSSEPSPCATTDTGSDDTEPPPSSDSAVVTETTLDPEASTTTTASG